MDPIRVIQIYVVQLGMGIFYLLISILVLKRDTKRLNIIFSIFFMSVFIGAVLNVIYAQLNSNPTVLILHFFTYYCFYFGFVFLVIFNIILLKSEIFMTNKKQYIFIIVYGIILALTALIPNAITINESTKWKPVWNLQLLIYALVISAVMSILTFYVAIRIYNQITDDYLKKRFRFFIIGAFAYFFYSFFLPIANFLNIQTVRLTVSIVGVIMLIISAPTMYYGVGKQLKK